MTYIFNLESGLFKDGELNHDVAMLYRHYRDVIHAKVHILSEQKGIDHAVAMAVMYDLNPNGYLFVRIDDNKTNDEVIADYVAVLDLTPTNTKAIYDQNNAAWWREHGFNIAE
ncbi:hypothetical protein VXS06_14820 [Photobacterium toruni]|uniref:Uncharacterized protein n=1 Tax=Photobacterium toruni TaxID=1935446 RepID=A0ABU6LCK8_9GAMM|nr:hypothetical protein [Photobacterium toruni]